jgi:hypothetical protein
LLDEYGVNGDLLCKYLYESGGVITGSFVLQVLLNETYENHDIDFLSLQKIVNKYK